MRTRFAVLLCAALVAGAALPSADAAPSRTKAASRPARAANTFALSTQYTGMISGDLLIDGVRYTLAPNAPVYVIGTGPVSQGVVVNARYIYLSGERRGGQAIVRSVIVRPDSRGGSDRPGDVGVVRPEYPY